jgi:hypothetical protein
VMKQLRYGNDEATNPIHISTVDTPGSVILRLILELWHRVGRKGVAKRPVELSCASVTRSVKAGA